VSDPVLSPATIQEIIDLSIAAKEAQAERLSRHTVDELAKASGRDADDLWDQIGGTSPS
jgi:hypothetical protein